MQLYLFRVYLATFLFPFFYNMETEKLQKVAQNYDCKTVTYIHVNYYYYEINITASQLRKHEETKKLP